MIQVEYFASVSNFLCRLLITVEWVKSVITEERKKEKGSRDERETGWKEKRKTERKEEMKEGYIFLYRLLITAEWVKSVITEVTIEHLEHLEHVLITVHEYKHTRYIVPSSIHSFLFLQTEYLSLIFSYFIHHSSIREVNNKTNKPSSRNTLSALRCSHSCW